MKNQISVSVATLERCAILMQQMIGELSGGEITEKQSGMLREANYLLAGLDTMLRSKAGPQNFSGNEVGQYTADPTKSQFL